MIKRSSIDRAAPLEEELGALFEDDGDEAECINTLSISQKY
tara:strand:- start:7091 stop:7213 length:123 start_codon:yes stop_codon:yes gene_type:complete